MAIKTFSEEEIIELRKNPYVRSVSKTTITYALEFKEYFIAEYEKGKAPSQIIKESGFDRTVLGKERCDNISRNFRRMSKRETGEYPIKV